MDGFACEQHGQGRAAAIARIGIAVARVSRGVDGDEGFQRVRERVDAGIGGHPWRAGIGEFGIDQRDLRAQRIVHDRDLGGAVRVHQDGAGRGLGAGARRRGQSDQGDWLRARRHRPGKFADWPAAGQRQAQGLGEVDVAAAAQGNDVVGRLAGQLFPQLRGGRVA